MNFSLPESRIWRTVLESYDLQEDVVELEEL